MKIGVLALQGAFVEHMDVLEKLGAETVRVTLPEHLDGLDGLIVPGGESTTIAKLAGSFGLMGPLREFARNNAVWGVCAGMIFLAKDIGSDQPTLGVMDIVIQRNAFGRQIDSFVAKVGAPLVLKDGKPFQAVFIRAPRLIEAKRNALVIARLEDGTPAAALEGNWLATAFHPELTDDPRFHEFFLELSRKRRI